MGNTIAIPNTIVSYWDKKNENTEEIEPEAKEAMAKVMQELKRMFEEEGSQMEDSWLLINSSIGPDESSAIMRSQIGENEMQMLGDDAPKVETTNVTTLAWNNPKDKVLSFVSYLWPKNQPENEKKVNIEDELKKQMTDQIQMIEKMREELNFLQQSIMERPTIKVKAWPVVSTEGIFPTEKVEQPEISEADTSPSDFAPPPPPPPPGTAFSLNSRPSITIGSISLKKEKAPVTRNQLETTLKNLISESDVMPQNREKVTRNFLQAFPSPQSDGLLEKMVTDYPFLVKKMPLKPKTCCQRMAVWEKNLFKEMQEEKQAVTLRMKKKVEIEKLEKDQEILEEIKKIKDFLEAQKKKELEEKKMKKNLGSLVDELSARLNRDKTELEALQAQKELEELEEGVIETVEI